MLCTPFVAAHSEEGLFFKWPLSLQGQEL
uniref:Uncharacterized protein n=1 Tax=Anguilla anguilla TaxID=7936 RepID=A0A0E9RU87_ANGAN